jgi:hypothetical protein
MRAGIQGLRSIIAITAVLITASSHAAFLEMLDHGGAGPVQILSDFPASQSETSFTNGTTRFTGVIALNTVPASIAVGTRTVALVEPTGQPGAPITDLITFTADEPFSSPIIHIPFQRITVDFTPGRFGPLTAPAGAIFMAETGQPQLLSDALTTSPLIFGVQSVGGAVVPEPSLLWFAALGLLGLYGYRALIRVRGRSSESSTLSHCGAGH